MEEEVFQQLQQALYVMLGPASTPDARRQATQFVEEFKAGSPMLETIGLRLASLSSHVGVDPITACSLRLFGLQLLEHSIRFRWNSYSPEQKQAMKAMLIEQLLMETNGITVEESSIKQKIGSIIAEAIKREWPQHWPNLVEQLMAVHAIDETRSEMVFIVFQALIEDVMEFDTNLPVDRKRELRASINECLPVLLSGLSSTLDRALTSITAGHQPAIIVSKTCLRVLTTTLGWAPLTLVFELGLLGLLCRLLPLRPLRSLACDCLSLIYDRKGPKEERGALLQILPFTNALLDSMPEPKMPIDDDDYAFSLNLGDVIVKIGVNQVMVFWSPSLPSLDVFAAGVLRLARHPSLRIVSMCLTVWITLLRQTHAAESCLASQFQSILEVCVLRVRKPPYLRAYAGPDMELQYANYGVSSRKEFDDHFAIVRNQIVTLVRMISGLAPLSCISLAIQCLVSVLQPVYDGSFNAGQHGGAFNAVVIFVDAVIHGVLPCLTDSPFDEPTKTQLAQHISQCFDGLLDVTTTDRNVLIGRITLLQSLFPFLKFQSGYLLKVLEILFANMDVVDAADDSAAIKADNVKLRRAAGSALIVLCQLAPPGLAAHLEDIFVRVRQSLARPDTTESNKRMMLEALLTAGNIIDAVQVHEGFIRQLLGGVIADWQSPELNRIVRDENQFVEFNSLSAVGENASAARNTFVNSTFGLVAAARCTKPRSPATLAVCEPPVVRACGVGGTLAGGDGMVHPFRDMLAGVFETVAALTRTLHRLWSNPATRLLPALLDLRLSEMEALVSEGGAVADNMTPADKWIDGTRYWLGGLRESCYILYGSACKQGFFYDLQNVAEALCVGELATTHFRHQRTYVKHVLTNLVLFAPRDRARFSLLEGALSQIYSHFLQLFSFAWERRRSEEPLSQGGPRAECAQLSEDLRDTAVGKLLDELIHDVLVQCSMIFANAADTQGEDAVQEYVLGPIAQLCINSSIAVPLLSIFAESIVSPNFLACRIASDALVPVVPILAKIPSYQVFLCDMLLRAVMSGLSIHGQHNECETHLLNLMSHILCEFGSTPVVTNIITTLVPGMTPISLDALVKFLKDRMHGKGHSGKQRRQEIRKYFAGIIGVNIGQQLRLKVDIKSLDIPLALGHKRSAQTTDVVESGDAGLADLFGEG